MKKEKWQQLAHLIAGVRTLVHGFEALEIGELFSAAAFLGCGILFLLVAGLHKSLLRKFMQGDTALFLLEGIIMLYSAWQYRSKDHVLWYYIMGLAGLAYVVLSLFTIKPTRQHHHRSGRRKKGRAKISGEEFIRAVRKSS